MGEIARGGVAIAAAAAALGTGSVASATVVHTRSNLDGAGTDPRFVALVDAELHRPETCLAMADMGAGQSDKTVDVPEDRKDLAAYTAFGIDDAGGIFVTFADPSVALGQTFESLFPGFSESELVTALQSDDPLVLTFASELGKTPGVVSPFGESSTVVHFSIGGSYGTFVASFDPIPTPSAVAPLACAGGIAARRRRR